MEALRNLYSSIKLKIAAKEQHGFEGDFDPKLFYDDTAFDDLYPIHIQALSAMHWTPVDIAKKAAAFLAIPGANVLDIGSGVGKFCITAGHFHPETNFCGVEQRAELFNYAEMARDETNLPNVRFIHGNLTGLDFADYQHFYFYNSFYENIQSGSRIDYTIKTSFELYDHYSRVIYQMLSDKPAGTRLVTYHAPDNQVPPGYRALSNSFSRVLKMWIKER